MNTVEIRGRAHRRYEEGLRINKKFNEQLSTGVFDGEVKDEIVRWFLNQLIDNAVLSQHPIMMNISNQDQPVDQQKYNEEFERIFGNKK